MKKYVWALCLCIAYSKGFSQSSGFDEKARAYVKQYGAWAIEEQQRVGIPASITLAQGIYETGAGESELATKANNHFGIKCKREWKGETFAHTDDAPNECFRKYKTAKDSYKDHSDYLKSSARYAELFEYDRADYTAWAKGLKKCGYATNPAYAQKLIKMVEDYDLQSYTFAADGKLLTEIVPEKETPVEVPKPDIFAGTERVNDLKGIYCLKGETLLDKAMKYNMRYARLLEINELGDEPLKRDMFIFLEPKKLKGAHATHTVLQGETAESIAHDEGMNTRQLRIYNLMAINEQPAVGAVLKLQEQADERPATYKQVKAMEVTPQAPVQQAVKLVSPANAVKQDEYLPTKKAPEKVEELEIGYGAEPPAELKAQLAKQQAEKVAISKAVVMEPAATVPVQQVQQVPVAPMQQKSPEQEVAKKNTVAPLVTTSGKPMLESELAAINDPGGLPLTLEPENSQPQQTLPSSSAQQQPKDELAELKARLDQAVYARTSKSNIKVSSNDSAALYKAKTSGSTTPQKQVAAPAVAAVPADAAYHTVQKGETGYSIAKKYSISVKQLNQWNSLNFDGIKVGQKLRIK